MKTIPPERLRPYIDNVVKLNSILAHGERQLSRAIRALVLPYAVLCEQAWEDARGVLL